MPPDSEPFSRAPSLSISVFDTSAIFTSSITCWAAATVSMLTMRCCCNMMLADAWVWVWPPEVFAMPSCCAAALITAGRRT